MSKYKLTTNLIADCMALIPKNLELLNKITQDLESKHANLDIKYLFYFDAERVYRSYFEYLTDYNQFGMISYCLRLIPEFKVKTKEGKTIASTTLHGQGEFPPSDLDELCKSYKNVMSKNV